MKVLVTGAAGFIGFHTALRLTGDGHTVVGLDSINDYYDPELKHGRLEHAGIPRKSIAYNSPATSIVNANYRFIQLNLEDNNNIARLFQKEQFDCVIHLAAQAGVRYSLVDPHAYVNSNLVGFVNILEGCRHHNVRHLIFASSSSVYGLNRKLPFSPSHNVDHPISLYAATKKSNELMAHTYSHLFNLKTTGLRFFTVYGPWGRPDMALFLFVKAALEGKTIDVFNNGDMLRDFTYIDDIVEGLVRVMERPPDSDPDWGPENGDISCSSAPYRIYNIGSNNPVQLMDFINAIETELGIEISKNLLPLQAGDVPDTYADVTDLVNDMAYKPTTDINTGISRFINWYRDYYEIPPKISGDSRI